MNHQHAETVLTLHARLITLKLLPRTGWLQRGMMHVESIAEHTFSVATLALLVGDIEPGLDRGKLLAIALLHDMAESLVGDLPFSARRLFGAEAKQEAEHKAMVELVQGLPQAQDYLELWDDYSHGTSREGRLVKQLDRIEMLSQALAYERAGNRGMDEFWQDIDEGWSDEFPTVLEIVAQLRHARERLTGNATATLASMKNGNGNTHIMVDKPSGE